MKTLDIWTDCDECGGSGGSWNGVANNLPPNICPACNGTGRRYDPKVVEAMVAFLGDDNPYVPPHQVPRLLDVLVAVADTVELTPELYSDTTGFIRQRWVTQWEGARAVGEET